MKMELEKAIEILENHNEWRRDENIPPKTDMQNPTDIGNAIDYALTELKKLRVADVIKNEVAVCDCKKYGIQPARMCSSEKCINKLDVC
jgi:hypothetical protein